MTETLILHVGHGKTGTSYIQSALAVNQERLAAAGITYPAHVAFDKAIKGLTSAGNGRLLHQPDFSLDPGTTTLLSNEGLFMTLSQDDAFERQVLARTGAVRVILYTRDILEMLISSWGQGIKRGGRVETFDEYARQLRDPHVRHLPWWIEAASRYGFELTLRNYSRHKSNILETFFADVMAGRDGTFEPLKPASERVNRSLTGLEYELQRVLNKVNPAGAAQVSDAMVNELPDVKSHRPRITAETYELLEAHYWPILKEINAHMPVGEALELGAAEDFVASDGLDPQYHFSNPQLEVTAAAIRSSMLGLTLQKDDVDRLRDTAMRIERREELGLEDGLFLMRLALAARPNGPAIRKKVEAWEKALRLSEN